LRVHLFRLVGRLAIEFPLAYHARTTLEGAPSNWEMAVMGTDPSPSLRLPSLEEIRAAAQRISGLAVRTPLVRLNVDEAPDIYLKLENLQPIGAFKIRGAGNALTQLEPARLSRGVYTASAGNMAQGLAWHARRLGIACTAVVPENAPETKLSAITRLGADYLKVPFDEWWQVILDYSHPAFADRLFVHPVGDQAVMAGNGTIGLEILEDLPDADAVIVPFGGVDSPVASPPPSRAFGRK